MKFWATATPIEAPMPPVPTPTPTAAAVMIASMSELSWVVKVMAAAP